MKKIIFAFILLFSFIAFAQQGKIYPKNKIKQGEVNTFIYEVPKDFIVPNNCWIYSISDDYNIITTPLIFKNGKHQFSLKTKDSESVIIITIVDKNLNPIETNNSKGYTIYLKHNPKQERQRSELKEIELRTTASISGLINNDGELLSKFEKLYQKNLALKDDRTFDLYLNFKKVENVYFEKNELPKIINSLIKKGSEDNLIVAHNQYLGLGWNEKKDSVYNLILSKYPLGSIAKKVFIQNIENAQNINSTDVVNLKKEFIKKFSDSSEQFTNRFDLKLLEVYLTEKNRDKINEIETHITDKTQIAYCYNYYAKKIAQQNPISTNDLEFATYISKKALDLIQQKINFPDFQEHELRLPVVYNQFLETYALLFFKSNN